MSPAVNPTDSSISSSIPVRRLKYTRRACLECQRRKSKCSGERPCALCRSRGVGCTYARHPRSRKTSSLITHRSSSELTGLTSTQVRPLPAGATTNQDDKERIRLLESTLHRVVALGSNALAATKEPSDDLPSPSDSCEIDDAFLTPERGLSEDMSFPGILSCARHLLGKHSTSRNTFEGQERGYVTVRPPSVLLLRNALQCCAFKLSVYQPVLGSQSLEPAIVQVFEHGTWAGSQEDALVRQHDLINASQAYIIVALSRCFETTPTTDQTNTQDWHFYFEGLRLLRQATPYPSQFVDMSKTCLLQATFLTQADKLQSASAAFWKSVSFAYMGKLNLQGAWSSPSPSEVLSRKTLWWSIYSFDRRLAQKCGRPAMIHDEDVTVDEMCSQQDMTKLKITTEKIGAEKQSQVYLQTLVDISRLWTAIWAHTSKRLDSLEGVGLSDLRIAHVQRNVPLFLRWEDRKYGTLSDEAENDLTVLRKLVIYARLNLLRLFVRRHPNIAASTDADLTVSRASLIFATTKALSVAVDELSLDCLRPASYFVASSLVECLYYATHALNVSTLPDQATCRQAAERAICSLQSMAPNIEIARKRLRKLGLPLVSAETCDISQDPALTKTQHCDSAQPYDTEQEFNISEAGLESQDFSFSSLDPQGIVSNLWQECGPSQRSGNGISLDVCNTAGEQVDPGLVDYMHDETDIAALSAYDSTQISGQNSLFHTATADFPIDARQFDYAWDTQTMWNGDFPVR